MVDLFGINLWCHMVDRFLFGLISITYDPMVGLIETTFTMVGLIDITYDTMVNLVV